MMLWRLRNLGTGMVLGVCFLEDRVLLLREDKDGILLAARVGGTNLPIRGEINIVPLPDPFRFCLPFLRILPHLVLLFLALINLRGY